MKKSVLIVLIVGFLILGNLSFVLADGAYFPHPGYWVRPGQQRGIIFYEDNTETLILTSGFQGNAKDLVWIIPTPTRPKVTKANEEIFTNIAKLTQPQYDRGIGYGMMLEAATAGTKTLGVAVIESKQVDYYDVTILVATNSQDLITWFNENGYDYPEEYAYVLNYYISKAWTFTAIKISPESQGATEVIQDLKEGNPTPIKMEFLSDKIVFPLKISSVEFKPENETEIGYPYYYEYGNYVPIQLYVVADSKYESSNPNLNIQYGNWFKKSQIESLGEDDNGEPLILPKENKYFITRLYANMQKSQMNDDIFLKKAEDNKKVNAGPETWKLFLYGLLIGFVLFITWIFTPLGIMFIAGTLILFLSSNKTARVFGWIIEILSLVLTFVIAIVFFSIAAINNSLGDYVVVSVLITALFTLFMMILLMILQVKYKRQKK